MEMVTPPKQNSACMAETAETPVQPPPCKKKSQLANNYGSCCIMPASCDQLLGDGVVGSNSNVFQFRRFVTDGWRYGKRETSPRKHAGLTFVRCSSKTPTPISLDAKGGAEREAPNRMISAARLLRHFCCSQSPSPLL